MHMHKKKYKNFKPQIRSRHGSHAMLRQKGFLNLVGAKSVIRFGSTTEYDDTISKGGTRIEVNTTDAVRNSSSKLKMKTCFTNDNVKTADWWLLSDKEDLKFTNAKEGDIKNLNDLPYPIISKSEFGSRNKGNTKHDNAEQLLEWINSKVHPERYIFEKYYNYAREYRLHIDEDECFYTCRKMLKRDTEGKDKWYRNDEHCVWVLEGNELFDKPSNWDHVITESIKALKAVGLDIGAVDLRIQSATDKNGEQRKNPEFIIVEINSAPSFGEVTLIKYKEQLNKILLKKYNER